MYPNFHTEGSTVPPSPNFPSGEKAFGRMEDCSTQPYLYSYLSPSLSCGAPHQLENCSAVGRNGSVGSWQQRQGGFPTPVCPYSNSGEKLRVQETESGRTWKPEKLDKDKRNLGEREKRHGECEVNAGSQGEGRGTVTRKKGKQMGSRGMGNLKEKREAGKWRCEGGKRSQREDKRFL